VTPEVNLILMPSTRGVGSLTGVLSESLPNEQPSDLSGFDQHLRTNAAIEATFWFNEFSFVIFFRGMAYMIS
jgi:hypothetical protein